MEEEKIEKYVSKTFLLSGKEFIKDLKEGEGVGYSIMVHPKEKKSLTLSLYL